MTQARPRRSSTRVTSIDVAREAKVSQATVSRAYSTPHAVSDDAKQRVYDAAHRLGYEPNAIARSLSSQRSRMIGVVVPAGSEYYEAVLTRFARHLAPLDHQLLLFEYDVGTDIERVVRAVRSYQVDALIVSAMIVTPSQAAALNASGIPVVMFNYQSLDDAIPFVSVDGHDAMKRLAGLLVNTGHRSIVFVGGPRDSFADQVRYRGASETLAEHGLACRYVEAGEFSYQAGLGAVGEILEAASAPDAVMASSDSIAFGVVDGLRASGLEVPEDVSVTGFDGLPQADWLAYQLTTVGQPMDDLVRLAVEQVLEPQTSPIRSHLIPGILHQRKTVAERR